MLNVIINDDNILEPDEGFVVRVESVTNHHTVSISYFTGLVTIVDTTGMMNYRIVYRIADFFKGEIFTNFMHQEPFVKILPSKCLLKTFIANNS